MGPETDTIQLPESELAEHLAEILDRVARGERVIVQRQGKDLAVIESAPSRDKWTWQDLVNFLNESPFDEEFARSVREFRDSQNTARFTQPPDPLVPAR